MELEQVLLRVPLKGRGLISAPGVGGFQDLSGKTSQIQRQDVPRHSRATTQEMSCTFVDVVDITWRGQMSDLLKHTLNVTDGWLSSPLPAAKTISQQLEVLSWGNVVPSLHAGRQ